MINGLKVIVVMPSYNASRTLRQTYQEIPLHIVDEVVLVDDHSSDDTLKLAAELDIKHIIKHDSNKGYGGNQKTCFDKALELGADIVVLLHPDYQYSPRLIGALCEMNASGIYDMVLASRILGGSALKEGMPFYKYVANRFLTGFQNILLGKKISEYHTGYRAYSRQLLTSVSYQLNSDGFIFDNQIISQAVMKKFRIGEISCPARYFPEASSIKWGKASVYGLGVMMVSFQHLFHRAGIIKNRRYQ